jgi:hypothetical protein
MTLNRNVSIIVKLAKSMLNSLKMSAENKLVKKEELEMIQNPLYYALVKKIVCPHPVGYVD